MKQWVSFTKRRSIIITGENVGRRRKYALSECPSNNVLLNPDIVLDFQDD